jgi:hypothetical protein
MCASWRDVTDVPYPDQAVAAAGEQCGAVGAEAQGVYCPSGIGEYCLQGRLVYVGDVIEEDADADCADGQDVLVLTEGELGDFEGRPVQRVDLEAEAGVVAGGLIGSLISILRSSSTASREI